MTLVTPLNVIIAPSQIHGVGLFTIRNLLKGQIIFEFDDFEFEVLPLTHLDKFEYPYALRYYFHNTTHIHRPLRTDVLRHSNYLNHDNKNPNSIPMSREGRLYLVAKKDIPAGVEILCNQRTKDYCPDCFMMK